MIRFAISTGLLALGLLAASCGTAPTASDPTIATTLQGQLLPLEAKDVLAFKGVPYPAAPVGDLRWKPPQPVTS